MALNPFSLSSALQSDWLPSDGGPYHANAVESGDAFAGAVSEWFASATAGAFPCMTATARRGQLASGAASAFSAQQTTTCAALLAAALAGYLAGQTFGAGVASAPLGVAAAQAAFAAVFADLDATTPARANRIAQATWALVLTTIVVFPPVISPPAPVT